MLSLQHLIGQFTTKITCTTVKNMKIIVLVDFPIGTFGFLEFFSLFNMTFLNNIDLIKYF